MEATRTRFIVVAFMVTLAMITYLDRACIGAMAPVISQEFALDAAQMGWVFFAFSLSYAVFEIPTALYADRHGARSTLMRIVTWWSLFTLATAATFNYVSLLLARFLFGMGEAGAWPSVARVFSRWIPLAERGTVKGVFFAGAYSSGALTTFTVTALLPFLDWRVILVIFGCVGFVWVIAWRAWFHDEPTDHPRVSASERALIVADRPALVPHPTGWAFWRQLLARRNVRLLCFMYMPNCATFYFCITWLPTYLKERHHFEKTELGLVAALPLFASIATQFLGGFWSDRVTRRRGLTLGRRTPAVIGYSLAAVFIFGASVTNTPLVAAVLIALAAASCMLTTAPAWSVCVDIGREHSAVVGATMNTAGNLAALFTAPAVGYSVKWFGNWNAPFYLLGGLFIMGAICWLFIEPREPVFEAAPAT
jgi:ACS family glucarate transporter-like MFS transporter